MMQKTTDMIRQENGHSFIVPQNYFLEYKQPPWTVAFAFGGDQRCLMFDAYIQSCTAKHATVIKHHNWSINELLNVPFGGPKGLMFWSFPAVFVKFKSFQKFRQLWVRGGRSKRVRAYCYWAGPSIVCFVLVRTLNCLLTFHWHCFQGYRNLGRIS